jgi:hypothetical protein
MTIAGKFDKTVTGVVSGLLLPFIVGIMVYLFRAGNISLTEYVSRIHVMNITTHAISLCVFPNVIIFLIFNRFDMLRACRGVLAITIAWAIIVFIVKFAG